MVIAEHNARRGDLIADRYCGLVTNICEHTLQRTLYKKMAGDYLKKLRRKYTDTVLALWGHAIFYHCNGGKKISVMMRLWCECPVSSHWDPVSTLD